MKKKAAVLLVGAMLVSAFTGSISVSAQEGGAVSGEITIWTWMDISEEIEAYEASHPDTKIEQVVIDAGDYMTKIQTTLASNGELPDLVWGEILNRGQLFEMDILDVLTEEPYSLDLSLVEESLIPTMQNEAGEIVGLERNTNPSGLAYHRGLAKEYLGTDDPKELEAMFPDWDTFIETGKEVMEKSEGKVSMFTSLGDVYYLMNGQSQNSRIVDGVIQTEAVKELFEQICKFRDAGIVSQIEQWTPAWYASFGLEDSIFSPMPSYGLDNFIAPNDPDGEGDWGLMTPPGGGFSWGGTCWGVTKDSENKELAWDFAYWDTFEEGAQIRHEHGETLSKADYMTDEMLNEESPYFGGQKIMEVYMKQILPTIHINIPTAYDYTDICTVELILSSLNADYDMTADEAVDTYVSEMQGQVPELEVK